MVAVDGHWSDFGPWSACSLSCGFGGTQTRQRTCSNPAPQNDGLICPGDDLEVRNCDTETSCCKLDSIQVFAYIVWAFPLKLIHWFNGCKALRLKRIIANISATYLWLANYYGKQYQSLMLEHYCVFKTMHKYWLSCVFFGRISFHGTFFKLTI